MYALFFTVTILDVITIAMRVWPFLALINYLEKYLNFTLKKLYDHCTYTIYIKVSSPHTIEMVDIILFYDKTFQTFYKKMVLVDNLP